MEVKKKRLVLKLKMSHSHVTDVEEKQFQEAKAHQVIFNPS